MRTLGFTGGFALLTLLIHVGCMADVPVKLVAMEFAGAVQSDKQGAFDYMLKDLSQQLDMPIEYQVFVPARGLQIFLNNQADCIIPSANYPPYFEGTAVIHSASFALSRFTAFTLEAPVIKEVSDLNKKIVGMIRDNKNWNYESHMTGANIKFVGVNDLSTLVKMLYLGRINVAIHERDDFLLQVSKLNFASPVYEKNTSLWSEQIVISCHNTASNRVFLDRLNPRIIAIVESQKMLIYYDKVIKNANL
jgi:ABC-type amino acid transport substrate-binding protein